MKKSDLVKVGGLLSSEPVIIKATWKKPVPEKAEILHKKYTEIKEEEDGQAFAFDSENKNWVSLSDALDKSKKIKADKNKDFHILNFDKHFEFDVGIIRPAFDEMERVLTIKDDKNRTATLISLCVRLEGENGKFDQTLTYDEACRLEWNLVRSLVDAIKATNNIPGEK